MPDQSLMFRIGVAKNVVDLANTIFSKVDYNRTLLQK